MPDISQLLLQIHPLLIPTLLSLRSWSTYSIWITLLRDCPLWVSSAPMILAGYTKKVRLDLRSLSGPLLRVKPWATLRDKVVFPLRQVQACLLLTPQSDVITNSVFLCWNLNLYSISSIYLCSSHHPHGNWWQGGGTKTNMLIYMLLAVVWVIDSFVSDQKSCVSCQYLWH